MLASRGRGEDGTEFLPFASVLGQAGAERCQAGHVALPALPNMPGIANPNVVTRKSIGQGEKRCHSFALLRAMTWPTDL